MSCETVRDQLTATCQPFLLKNFMTEVFKCHCGCGLGLMDMNFNMVISLDFAKATCPAPMDIRSAMRCEKHNAAVGGSPTSSHLIGEAVDIATPDSWVRYEVVHALICGGFRRLGIYRDFVHADTDGAKPGNLIWRG